MAELLSRVRGLRELEAQIERLGARVSANKLLLAAMRSAVRPVHKQARAEYLSFGSTGNLARHLRVRSLRSKGGLPASVTVGFSWRRRLTSAALARELKTGLRDPYYAQFVELGFRHRSGVSVPGRGALRRAWDAHENSLISRMVSHLRRAVDKEIARA